MPFKLDSMSEWQISLLVKNKRNNNITQTYTVTLTIYAKIWRVISLSIKNKIKNTTPLYKTYICWVFLEKENSTGCKFRWNSEDTKSVNDLLCIVSVFQAENWHFDGRMLILIRVFRAAWECLSWKFSKLVLIGVSQWGLMPLDKITSIKW